MVNTYTLKDRKPVRCSDLHEWGRWMENSTAERVVAGWEFEGTTVSTVFLGLDHRIVPGYGQPVTRHDPIVFETMIFGGPRDGDMYRYSTWEAAEKGHMKVCEEIRRAR